MKLAYEDLKELVKEALIEILQEGLGNVLNMSSPQMKPAQTVHMPKNDMLPVSSGLIENKTTNKPLMQKQNLNQSKQMSQPVKKSITTPGISETKDLAKMKNMISQNKSGGSSLRESIKTVTDDPVLASIFADTASTTLMEQARAEKSNILPVDAASQVVADNDLMDLFGDGANNWEKLAFSSKDLTKK